MNQLDHPVAIYLSAVAEWEERKFKLVSLVQHGDSLGLESLGVARLMGLQQKIGQMGHTAVMVEVEVSRRIGFSWKHPGLFMSIDRNKRVFLMFDGMFWTGSGQCYCWDDLYRRKRIDGWRVRKVEVFSQGSDDQGGGRRAPHRSLRRTLPGGMTTAFKSILEDGRPETREFFDFVDDRLARGLRHRVLARQADACRVVGPSRRL